MDIAIAAFAVLAVPVVLFLLWDQWRLGKTALRDAKRERPFPAMPAKPGSRDDAGANGGGGDGCGGDGE